VALLAGVILALLFQLAQRLLRLAPGLRSLPPPVPPTPGPQPAAAAGFSALRLIRPPLRLGACCAKIACGLSTDDLNLPRSQ